ncbi:uncharacterized protein CPUR_06281 [Claviceps purpurea 20.1]|uniref:Uncharacterized protein n=1 Tax=Claviceps purpurea (strain 20.1) TaxID=1111077 RepID=M1W351_CLAP2|nr:uncharacterized protein CPUR_06281 [Claviceps purpurea 20.1]
MRLTCGWSMGHGAPIIFTEKLDQRKWQETSETKDNDGESSPP